MVIVILWLTVGLYITLVNLWKAYYPDVPRMDQIIAHWRFVLFVTVMWPALIVWRFLHWLDTKWCNDEE